MQRKQRPYIRINISENVTYDDRTKIKHMSHKKNVDKYKGTKHRIKPKDSPIGSKGKIQHMLCTADIRSLQWGWI